ncbi:MAG: type I-D CRISPR-associated protein Cas5/Csc1 [Thermus sp.]|uniref:type I-D CRISPR-associated protein Cas5/Csc1 n=1 Tax=Thermus sp. TaxID=275 RepID=UPI00391A1E9F
MQIYRVSVELLDYVFYATTERGKVHETGAFLHNYALAYALGLARGSTYTYARKIQQPHYEEELSYLNGVLYLTPAAPLQALYRVVQWNSIGESFVLTRERSAGYPDWGLARVLRPGSRFRFYLLLHGPERLPDAPALRVLLDGGTVRVRLGKFPAKARLRGEPAQRSEEKRGSFVSEALLNWRDLEADPLVCDVVPTGRPTTLIFRANFDDEPFYEATFGNNEDKEVVRLPKRMGFLARGFRAKSGRRNPT